VKFAGQMAAIMKMVNKPVIHAIFVHCFCMGQI
jgi:hypothetical protein